MSRTNISINVSLFVVLLSLTSAYAGDNPDEVKRRIGGGDPVAGKDRSVLCQGCHGEDGNSMVPNFPKLTGQYAEYLVRQIKNFQAGSRSDPTMTEMAATVTNPKDMNDIAAYFASQNSMSGTTAIHKEGQKLALSYGCINCHGEDGKGKPAYNSIFPVIGGQHKDYLLKQLNDFKTAARDTDMSGTMGDLTNRMTDAEMDAVAEYFSGL